MSSDPGFLIQSFDDCAQMLVAGESISTCLARFPDQSSVLEPLLSSVATLRSLAAVPARLPEIAARRRADFIAALDGMTAISASAGISAPASALNRPFPLWQQHLVELWRTGPEAWWQSLVRSFRGLAPLPRGLAAAMAGLLLVGMLVTGTAGASATALPGDALYGVKLAGEQVRLFLTFDPTSREAFDQQYQDERRWETAEIMKIRRSVPALPLAGRLESFTADRWWVGGLAVEIDEQTRIEGTPIAGAAVHGTTRAPGDGTLIGVRLVVEPPTGGATSPAPTIARPAPATAAAPSVPSATASPSPSPSLMAPEPALWPWTGQPDATSTRPRRATSSPPPAFTVPPPATNTATSTPAAPPTLTLTPAAATQPRSDPKVRLSSAYVSTIAGALWTAGGVTFETDSNTRITGDPGVGDKIDVLLLVRGDGSYLALEISLVARKAEPFELTGVLSAKGSSWIIGGTAVLVTPQTIISGDPQVGDTVHCAGLRDVNGNRAVSIERLLSNVVEFSGFVEAVNADGWVVSGRLVYRGLQTQVTGSPAVGRIVDVRAEQQPGGRLVALLIYVRPDTPVPTATATAKPSATNTPAPAATATNNVAATPTNTPVPPATTAMP